MTTLEEKAKLWLKHVNAWLNKYTPSSLSDPAMLLLERLKKEYDRNELKKAWDVIDDLNRLSETSSDGLESAEIRLQCGMIVAKMGNFKEAQKLFSEASSRYSHSHHHYAIALWMKGCMEWLLPGKEVDAINSWREAEKKFETLKKGKESKKDEYSWYDSKYKEMHSALHQAAEKYEIPLLPFDSANNENTASNEPANNNREVNLRSDRMGLFSVHESINAGFFGSSEGLGNSVGNLEVEQVFIDDRPFRILAINGSSFFRASTQETIAVKVIGDSMNRADIQSGDYVLLRLLPKNFGIFNDTDNQNDFFSSHGFKDGDIVAAEILSEEGNVAMLKRVFRRGKKIVLQPQSTNPEYEEREFDVNDEGFLIGGVVVAILKPV